ncbi:putative LRR receptor-like serine/threonine-protein kinase [Abeliophyllum distichum]|uniref:LRR receptor-like serine/threonine-protein kinase n=1 Tax=Abeliophyllum distichum TaxID=126358 RepID=A0ABD1TKI5_9LAMI
METSCYSNVGGTRVNSLYSIHMSFGLLFANILSILTRLDAFENRGRMSSVFPQLNMWVLSFRWHLSLHCRIPSIFVGSAALENRGNQCSVFPQVKTWMFDVSQNKLEEEILVGGRFANFTAKYFEGTLSDGLNVAVKVFNFPSERVSKSFDIETEILSTIHHRNLVRIIGCCSNKEFKALTLEYMPNGSLEIWLYSHNYFLDMLKRFDIAIDVALALEYLHHGLTFTVLHCDLKPRNVLLDQYMVGHVGDFGIARLFGQGESIAQTKTLATIGYMVPEYGSEGIVSTSGDVYSFGIMLLEMYMRKKPTDAMFGEKMRLKGWVIQSLDENKIIEVVDANLLRREDTNFSA